MATSLPLNNLFCVIDLCKAETLKIASQEAAFGTQRYPENYSEQPITGQLQHSQQFAINQI